MALETGVIEQAEQSSLSETPASGKRLLYPKSDGWYEKNSAGVETKVGPGGSGGGDMLLGTNQTVTSTKTWSVAGTDVPVTLQNSAAAGSGAQRRQSPAYGFQTRYWAGGVGPSTDETITLDSGRLTGTEGLAANGGFLRQNGGAEFRSPRFAADQTGTIGRFIGQTASTAPTTGTHAVGDYVVTAAGDVYVCTFAGTPGDWVSRHYRSNTTALTAAYTNSTVTYTTVVSVTTPFSRTSRFRIRAFGVYRTAATTTGIGLQLIHGTPPTGTTPTGVSGNILIWNANTPTNVRGTAFPLGPNLTTAVTAANTDYHFEIEACYSGAQPLGVNNISQAVTFNLQARSEIAASLVTIQPGAYMTIEGD